MTWAIIAAVLACVGIPLIFVAFDIAERSSGGRDGSGRGNGDADGSGGGSGGGGGSGR